MRAVRARDGGWRRAALAAGWHRSLGMSLVYFCSEHIEDAEASRGARVWWLLAHDINSELHLLDPCGGSSPSFTLLRNVNSAEIWRQCRVLT